MKRIALTCLLSLSLTPLVLCAQAPHKPAANACSSSLLGIDGNQIWVNKEGAGNVTVVFESGFGNDSSVWSQVASRIRAAGAQTFVYDRAGLGKSKINTATPYSLDNDVHILRTALTNCGIQGPVVMVGHSYGGAISLLAASEDTRIKGLVLLDAVVPGVWPKSELDKNLETMRAQYKEVREQAPDLAKVAIPWAEAMPETAKRVDGLRISDTLPIEDVVAEKGQSNPASMHIWRDAHAAFTANHPHRESMLAAGSSHKVMADKPDLVVDAIVKMLKKTTVL
ncbi:alpha/beta fold hydrolase [Dyella tabacisoli]|nr:alpha/beta hydrolase [Dyella tabacisoli]